MNRRASIDLGTNTALLLVAELTNENGLQPLYQEERIVRLGENVDQAKRLSDAAIERAIRAIEDLVRKARSFGVISIVISGTSAVRDAGNREMLVQRIRESMGLEMRILSGQDEARLTYWGALSNKAHLGGSILLIDIGGGSTECILGTVETMQKSLSLDIGSVRLTERFIKNDPVSDGEGARLRHYIKDVVRGGLAAWQVPRAHFLGVAGTATTLAAMRLGLGTYDAGRVDGLKMAKSDIEAMVDELAHKTVAERQAMVGLRPERADVILAGAIILDEFMNFFDFEQVIVSDRGLRFGLLLECSE